MRVTVVVARVAMRAARVRVAGRLHRLELLLHVLRDVGRSVATPRGGLQCVHERRDHVRHLGEERRLRYY